MENLNRLERWVIVGDGLSYRHVIVPDTNPLTIPEVLKLCHCQNAVITMFDALTKEFLGMAYISHVRPDIEMIRYGRRKGDVGPYDNSTRIS